MGATADEVITRLMQAFGVHDEATLAIRLGRDASTVRVWKSRGAVPLLVLRQAAQSTGVSLDWLEGRADDAPPLTGDGDGQARELTAREAQLVDDYRAAPVTARETVTALVHQMAGQAQEQAQRANAARLTATTPSNLVSIGAKHAEISLRMAPSRGIADWRKAPALPRRRGVNISTTEPGGVTGRNPPALMPVRRVSDCRPLTLTALLGRPAQEVSYEVIPRIVVDAGQPTGEHADTADLAGEWIMGHEWMRRNLAHTSGMLATIHVRGDSMLPSLTDGETIIIDTAVQRVDSPGVYVIDVDGDRLIKRIDRRVNRSLVIRSDNPAYPPDELTAAEAESVRIVGRMVWPVLRFAVAR